MLGIIVLGYTLFRNVWPLPTGVAWWGPSVAIAWLVVGIAWVLARPAATRRAGELLTRPRDYCVVARQQAVCGRHACRVLFTAPP